MKRLVLSAAFIAVLAASVDAPAKDLLNTAPAPGRPYGPWYGSLSGGYAKIEDQSSSADGFNVQGSTNGGYVLATAIGYKWPKSIRTELEFSYQHNSVDSVTVNGTKYDMTGDIEAYGLAVNGFYDIPTGTKWRPYLGGGAGGAHLKAKNLSVAGSQGPDSSTDRAELHGEVGLGYELGHEITIGPSYRYTYIFDGNSIADNDVTHQVKLGVRFPFR